MNSSIAGRGSLRLAQMTGYAFRVVAVLAGGSGGSKTIAQLAAEDHLPKSFLAKIVRHLVRAGILSARSGAAGGVRLARDPEHISLLEVIEACEGGYTRRQCVYYADRVCPGTKCPVWCDLRRVEESVMAELRKISVARLALDLVRHPQRMPA